jgi:ABC-type phosphate/phosphonate transport system ATPase subunit
MTYEYSELDKKNLGWFTNDFTRATLTGIRIHGSLRGLKDLLVEFSYPITAIAGRNGSGKTTILHWLRAQMAIVQTDINYLEERARITNIQTFLCKLQKIQN